MTHLSTENILDYINAKKVDAETLAFIAKVNEHILACSACREKVEAFEAVDDAMREAIYEKACAAQQDEESEIVL